MLYNIYSLCFIVILYFLLLTFFYSLAFAFYLFSITLRDHECPSNLLVLAINFFFFSKTQVLFSVLPKDLTKSTVLSLTSTTIWEAINYFPKCSHLDVWLLNKPLDVVQRLKFVLLHEVSTGCQYQSFLNNVKINDLHKSLNTDQIRVICTAQKLKFSIKDFLSKCDWIRRLLKKISMEKFIFCAVLVLSMIILMIACGSYILL